MPTGAGMEAYRRVARVGMALWTGIPGAMHEPTREGVAVLPCGGMDDGILTGIGFVGMIDAASDGVGLT